MTGGSDLDRRPVAELARPVDEFELAVEAFLTSKRSAETRRAYRADLALWRAWCEGRGVSPWRAQQVTVDSWARAMEDTDAAPSSVARRLSAVASFYRYLGRLPHSDALEALGWTWTSPTTNVDRPSFGGEGKTMALTAAELDAVLHAARWTPEGCTCKPRGLRHGRDQSVVVMLLATTAIRARELVTAKRVDFTVAHGHKVIVVTRKGGKQQRLTLEPQVGARLERWLANQPSSPYLIGTGNPSGDYKRVYRLSERIGLEAGISRRRDDGTIERHLTPHVFRATFATLYLDSPNANLAWLQSYMGHASPTTTVIYDRGAGALARLADVAHTVTRQIHID